MNPQVLSFRELVDRYRAGVISDEQVEEHYGPEALTRILNNLQEQCYAHAYA